MNGTRDQVRRALSLAAQSMSRTISTLREVGQHELADELKTLFDCWVSMGNRGVRRCAPHGRQVVPPIVPASYTLPPPRKLVRITPEYREIVRRLRQEAEQPEGPHAG